MVMLALALAACGMRIEPDRSREGNDLRVIMQPETEGFDDEQM